MRLSTYLKISVLTGAVMTPAMAQDAETAQQEALKRLREAIVSEAPAPRSTVPTASIGPANTSQQAQTTGGIAYPGAPVSANAVDQAKQRLRSADSSLTGTTSLQNPGLQVRPSMERSRETEAAVSQSRTERELRLQQQAQQAEIARQQKLSEKRRTWEVDIAERERLRQRQRDFDESVAKELGGRNVSPTQAFNNQATTLNTSGAASRAMSSGVVGVESDKHGTFEPEYIRQLQARAQRLAAETSGGSATTASGATSATAAPTAEAAVATPGTAATQTGTTGSDEAAIEARALDIVRQNQAAAATAPQTTPAAQIDNSASSATAATPNEETIRRAQELLRSQQGTASQPAPAPVSRDPQTRGMEVLRQQAGRSAAPTTSTTVRPTLDPSTQKIIEKQDKQIGSALSGTGSATASKTIGVETPATNVKTDDLEAQARETLRQQQEAAANTAPPVVQPNTPVPATATAPTTSSTPAVTTPPGASPANGVVTTAPGNEATFSPEVEARARQILRERAAAGAATSENTGSTATTTQAPATGTTGSTTNASAAQQPADTANAQAQALQVLRSQQPTSSASGSVSAPKTTGSTKAAGSRKGSNKTAATAAETTNVPPATTETTPQIQGLRSKQQRLADLTQAYIADKMTPAEYHAERARILAEPESK